MILLRPTTTCRSAAGCSRPPQAATGARPITFSRRSSAFIANARVSSMVEPKSSGLALVVPGRLQHAVGDRRHLGERARDRVAVARVLLRHLAQEARAEGHVAVLVAGDRC